MIDSALLPASAETCFQSPNRGRGEYNVSVYHAPDASLSVDQLDAQGGPKVVVTVPAATKGNNDCVVGLFLDEQCLLTVVVRYSDTGEIIRGVTLKFDSPAANDHPGLDMVTANRVLCENVRAGVHKVGGGGDPFSMLARCSVVNGAKASKECRDAADNVARLVGQAQDDDEYEAAADALQSAIATYDVVHL
jgi:hypothetical protein